MSEEAKNFRFLWHSVAGSIRSGYGNLTRHICSRLVAKGYQIIVSAYYGLEPGGMILINGVPHIPSKIGNFGEISALEHVKNYKINASILTTDFWAFGWFPEKMVYPILHSPMDHENYNRFLLDMVKRYEKVCSFCRWQQSELKKEGVDSYYIPHGVDTKIFQPIDQIQSREIMRLPKDKFIIGWVAANSDKEPRKGWTQGFEGIKYFLEQNPDAAKDLFVFCHTNPMDERGLNLQALKDYLGLNKFVYFENPMVSQTGIRDEELAMIYNSSDIMLNPSRREGFGLPIIEAMACGTPVIGTDFSAMTELIKGKGWLSKVAIRDITPIMAITAIPDPHSIADCIEDAYNNPNKILQYGKKANEFAKQYEWDLIIENNWIPFLNESIKDSKPKSLKERKIF